MKANPCTTVGQYIPPFELWSQTHIDEAEENEATTELTHGVQFLNQNHLNRAIPHPGNGYLVRVASKIELFRNGRGISGFMTCVIRSPSGDRTAIYRRELTRNEIQQCMIRVARLAIVPLRLI